MPKTNGQKPKLAVWKFTSCDGCQLSLLDCEDELLALLTEVELAHFPEASRKHTKGPFDLSLVEGSITTPHEVKRIIEVRKASKILVTMGACASAGGLQALRNFSDVEEFASLVYPLPDYIETLRKAAPVSDYVKVDYELRGCPVDQNALLETIKAFLLGQPLPQQHNQSVCVECKQRGISCLMRQGKPCMGPITHSGCGALCPSYNRACAGCYGPQELARPQVLIRRWRQLGIAENEIVRRVYRGINANAEVFRNLEATQEAESGAH